MRCSCRVCGTYMVQVEHGLQSGCKCPDCGNECHDCMGSAQPPMSVEQLRERLEFMALTGQLEGDGEEEYGRSYADGKYDQLICKRRRACIYIIRQRTKKKSSYPMIQAW